MPRFSARLAAKAAKEAAAATAATTAAPRANPGAAVARSKEKRRAKRAREAALLAADPNSRDGRSWTDEEGILYARLVAIKASREITRLIMHRHPDNCQHYKCQMNKRGQWETILALVRQEDHDDPQAGERFHAEYLRVRSLLEAGLLE